MLSWSHWSSVVCLKSVACHLQAYKLNLVAGVVQKSPLTYLHWSVSALGNLTEKMGDFDIKIDNSNFL